MISIYMNKSLETYKLIQKYTADHRGVFTVSDLKNLLQEKDATLLYRQIKGLEQQNILKRFSRGIYITKDYDLEALSQRLCPESYISFGNILAKELVIGSVPQKTVYAVKIGKGRRYRSDVGEIVHFFITPSLFFGFKRQDGVNYADKEKAFLDTLYFYQKGQKFSFNIYHDINVDLLDQKKIRKYLTHYKNPKFIKFVKGVINA